MNNFNYITDFHEMRKTGVGASDIPILAGLSIKYGSTALKLWRQKTGIDEPWAGNEQTEWGRKMEGLILKEFINKKYENENLSKLVYKAILDDQFNFNDKFYFRTECRHPVHQYAFAHADLLYMEDVAEKTIAAGENIIFTEEKIPIIVEAKNTGAGNGKRRKGAIFEGYDQDDLSANGIPDSVFLQVQWQLFCYGIEKAYVSVLIDGWDHRIYGPIQANNKVQSECLALALRFWRLVESKTPPAPDTWEDVCLLYPERKPETAMISGDEENKVNKMLAEYKKMKERIKEIEAKKQEIYNAIGILLGENKYLFNASGDKIASSFEKSKHSISYKNALKEKPKLIEELEKGGFIKHSTWTELRI